MEDKKPMFSVGDFIHLDDNRIVCLTAVMSRWMFVDFDDDDNKRIYTIASAIDENHQTVFAVKLEKGWYNIDLR